MHRLLSYQYLYLIPITLSALVSLKGFEMAAPYRLFSIFLLFTLSTEFVAICWKWYWYQTSYWSFSRSNLFIYSAYISIRLSFFSLIYYKVIRSPTVKNAIKYVCPVLLMFALIDYFYIEGPNQMNIYSTILSYVAIVLFALAFFYQVLKEDEIIRLSSNPMIWISLGSFVYYTSSLPFFIFLNYLSAEFPKVAISFLYINHALNIIMYSSYLIAYLCKPLSPK